LLKLIRTQKIPLHRHCEPKAKQSLNIGIASGFHPRNDNLVNAFVLKQFVPSDFCLKCFGCCRFRENPSIWAPAGCGLVRKEEEFLCANLNPEDNRCNIYGRRPLDCRLYPFLLSRKENALKLSLHKACVFIDEKKPGTADIQRYVQYLKEKLNTGQFVSFIQENPAVAADYEENVELLADLEDVFTKAYLPRLNKLTLKDKPLIERYLKENKTDISAYHFAAIFIWKDLFQVFWTVIEKNLCLFYQDNTGMFMALPPLGPFNAGAVKKCFALMNFSNQNSEVSRIENVSQAESTAYSQLGLRPKLKDREYVCLRDDLVNLHGDGFRHKRASYNHFIKTHNAQILEYNPAYQKACLRLYRLWMNMREDKRNDIIYQQMLEDSSLSFQTALKYYGKLGLAGYVVKAGGEIKACSFGYPLNRETFCILFEVCDLNFKGIAQFIFREFARKLSGYKYVNIMGASDLENLKKHKLSYRPAKEIGVYNIYYPRLSVYKNG
jgi:Fe-S-cluster containining protein